MRGVNQGKIWDWVPLRVGVVALVVVGGVVGPVVWWSARQSRLTNEALERAIAAEKAAARAQSGVDQSMVLQDHALQVKRDGELVRAKHRPSKADIERTQRLSQEIEGLGAIQEKIEHDLYTIRRKAAQDAKSPKEYYPLP